MNRSIVIGAGLAGLVAAERLAAAGRAVTILEASPKVGGRCRSYRDDRLGRVIDNGNHLMLSANEAALAWARRIGGGAMLRVGEAAFPFLDLGDGARWVVRPGRTALGALGAGARPPGLGLRALLRDMAGLMTATPERTVAQAVAPGLGMARFWDPMTRAVLNEAPEHGAARLLRAALLRSFAKGRAAARPVFAPKGLGPALIDPVLPVLRGRGVDLQLRRAVTALAGGERLTRIETAAGAFDLGGDDVAVVALPPRQMADLLPGLRLPASGRAILNAHFLFPESRLPPLLGLVGADAHWLFRRDDVVSVTVSAEEDSPLAGLPRDAALSRLWRDVAAAAVAHGATPPAAMPPARLLRERAATFDQSPDGAAARATSRTPWPNLFLAGDHTDTGLPATLEGAVRSGETAARLALG